MASLHTILEVKLHIVAQVVESEFIICSVSHITVIGIPALVVVQVVLDHSD